MFECGNLERAIALSETEYNLYIRPDTNSYRQAQWFYFAVTNTKRGCTIKFNIINQTRSPDFYKKGMKPFIYSIKDGNWKSNVSNIKVLKVPMKSQYSYNISLKENKSEEENSPQGIKFLYTVSFTHTFANDDDKVYFAYAKPYTFTRLNNFLKTIENNLASTTWKLPEVKIERDNIFYKREILCYTLGGVPMYSLIITDKKMFVKENVKKQYIVITARVHSSETPGSFKVEGIVKFLLSKDNVAEQLRNEFVFLIVPMLNPDGVILGNHRCSLGGYDLNRCWENPCFSSQPTIFSIKQRLQSLISLGEKIVFYCDLHGHSKELNSFLYACHSALSNNPGSWTRVHLFPRLLARNSPLFAYHQCSFRIEPDRLSTGRIVAWRGFKIENSFTLETSIYGYLYNKEIKPFSEKNYFNLAEAFLKALND